MSMDRLAEYGFRLTAFWVPVAGALAGGFAQLEEQDGQWYFVKDAERFFSFGVNYVSSNEYWPSDGESPFGNKSLGYYDVQENYGYSYADWAAATEVRLRSWGFNTVGSWSRRSIYARPMLQTLMLSAGNTWGDHPLVDVFGWQFRERLRVVVEQVCLPNRDNKWLIGYFIGNELPWYGKHAWPSGEESLLSLYGSLDAYCPGKMRLIQWLRESFHDDFKELRKHFATDASSWESLQWSQSIRAWSFRAQEIEYEWAGIVADAYYRTCREYVLEADPNHLILGSRFASDAPLSVWEAAGRYCDVLSTNYYTEDNETGIERWRSLHALTGRPILISESSWRAVENASGNPNVVGASCTVPDQASRASKVEEFVAAWMNEPYMLGVHWFEYFDQPPGGRGGSGEDSNYGLVDIFDRPYESLVDAWRALGSAFAGQRPWATSKPEQVDYALFSRYRPAIVASPSSEFAVTAWSWRGLGLAYGTVDRDGGGSCRLIDEGDGKAWSIDTGLGWGASLVLHPAIPRFAVGAGMLEIDMALERGVYYRIAIREAANEKGGDGESFVAPPLRGVGERTRVRVPLEYFALDTNRGNQDGDGKLSAKSIASVALLFRGSQGMVCPRIWGLRWLPINEEYEPFAVDLRMYDF